MEKLKKKVDTATKLTYKQFRNQVATELKESKIVYFHNYFKVNSTNMELLFTGIKFIISTKNSHVNVINKFQDANGNLATDSALMANIFSNFFVNIADGVAKSIPRSIKSPLDYLDENNPHSSSVISPAARYEISDIINLFKTGKLIGLNSISIKLLKFLSPHISSPLSQIMIESFWSGVFPE